MRCLAAEFSSDLPHTTLATMAILQLPNIGCARYWQLIKRFGSVSALLQLSDAEQALAFQAETSCVWRSFCETPKESTLGQTLHRILESLKRLDIQVLACGDDNYPQLLQQISKPPALLYLRGDSACLELPQLGVVGSRRPTPVGLSNAHDFSAYLAAQGFVITSGLALGVDTAAHRGALQGGGKTLAVLGTGIDCIYPRQNRLLADDIVGSGGLIVSEFALGTTARPGNFPQRNRIISGLSLGVLVVEAAEKSGSLITARLASEQGREVFALPGSIHCPVSRGCNGLIRQGATLVESAEHIVTELHGMLALKSEQLSLLPTHGEANDSSTAASHTVVQTKLLDALGYEATSLDELASRSEVEIGTLLAELMALELNGIVSQVATGYLRVK
jgi:DNA processing protein